MYSRTYAEHAAVVLFSARAEFYKHAAELYSENGQDISIVLTGINWFAGITCGGMRVSAENWRRQKLRRRPRNVNKETRAFTEYSFADLSATYSRVLIQRASFPTRACDT